MKVQTVHTKAKTMTSKLKDGVVVLMATPEQIKLRVQTDAAYCDVLVEEHEVGQLAEFFDKSKDELKGVSRVVDEVWVPGG